MRQSPNAVRLHFPENVRRSPVPPTQISSHIRRIQKRRCEHKSAISCGAMWESCVTEKSYRLHLYNWKSMNIPAAAATREENELKNLHELAKVITRSAIAREESRGSHYRSDFPYRDDDDFQKHSLIRKGAEVTFER